MSLNQYSQHTDKELFDLMAQGNENAFSEVYLRYVPRLYAHISRLLDGTSWADEIVQDLFAKLWQIREALRDVDNPSAYLYRMAANRTLDFIKHRAVEVKMQYQIARYAEGNTRSITDDWMDFKQADALYRQAIRLLPSRQQRIFHMRHDQGMSYDEIAMHLNLSKSTVRNQLSRSIERIRVFLLRHGLHVILLAHLYYASTTVVFLSIESGQIYG